MKTTFQLCPNKIPLIIGPHLRVVITTGSSPTRALGPAFPLSDTYTCQNSGVVYMITCEKCGIQYVGQTKRKLQHRFSEHLGYIDNKENATGKHFSSQGHSKKDAKVQIIERVFPNSSYTLSIRETHWIKKLKTKLPYGLNKII